MCSYIINNTLVELNVCQFHVVISNQNNNSCNILLVCSCNQIRKTVGVYFSLVIPEYCWLAKAFLKYEGPVTDVPCDIFQHTFSTK